MKIKPVKYEFLAQRKEAMEMVQEWFPASLRTDLERTLSLRRPDKMSKKVMQALQSKLK
jgi:hypothetical protein